MKKDEQSSTRIKTGYSPRSRSRSRKADGLGEQVFKMDPSRCGAAPKSFRWIHAPALKEVDEPVHQSDFR